MLLARADRGVMPAARDGQWRQHLVGNAPAADIRSEAPAVGAAIHDEAAGGTRPALSDVKLRPPATFAGMLLAAATPKPRAPCRS